jgi:hypothetical protein
MNPCRVRSVVEYQSFSRKKLAFKIAGPAIVDALAILEGHALLLKRFQKFRVRGV